MPTEPPTPRTPPPAGRTAPLPGPPAPGLPLPPPRASPFLYVGGDPALDLVNSADWDPAGAVLVERIADYPSLAAWAGGCGILDHREEKRLLRRSRNRPRRSQAALRAAHALRASLRAVFLPVARGEGLPGGAELGNFNAWLGAALARLRLAPFPDDPPRPGSATAPAVWRWEGHGVRLRAPLWPVVRSAALLLTSSEASRIRVCPGEGCGWLFVDRSRNGRRRWCRMETCGTREKNRRRRSRTGE